MVRESQKSSLFVLVYASIKCGNFRAWVWEFKLEEGWVIDVLLNLLIKYNFVWGGVV